MKSINPISKSIYDIPKGDDKLNIDNFVKSHKGKRVVVVQGLGFVGAAMTLVIANSNKNYAVIGVDMATKSSYWKIAAFNNKEVPIVSSDPKIEEYFNKAMKKKNLYA